MNLRKKQSLTMTQIVVQNSLKLRINAKETNFQKRMIWRKNLMRTLKRKRNLFRSRKINCQLSSTVFFSKILSILWLFFKERTLIFTVKSKSKKVDTQWIQSAMRYKKSTKRKFSDICIRSWKTPKVLMHKLWLKRSVSSQLINQNGNSLWKDLLLKH